MSEIIPDPTRPEHVAIDGATGDLLGGVFMLKRDPDGKPPTAAELEHGQHIGWTRGIDLT